MKWLTNEVKIAVVAIVGIVVLFFGMQFLKGLTMFTSGNSYCVEFDNVSGLSSASPVYANGYKVGVVEQIDYDFEHPEKITAMIGLDKKMRLARGTTAEISSDLLGNVKLELHLGASADGLLAEGDTIQGGTANGLMGKAADMLPQVQQLLPKLDSILVSVNTLLADPSIKQSLGNIDAITTNLTTTTQQLNQLTAELNRQMPQLMGKANGVLANTEGLTQQLNGLELAATMKKVDNTMANMEQVSAALASRDGTLGMLMHDPGLYKNLNATMNSADSLLIDLRLRPKRYVHFSLFGRKDK